MRKSLAATAILMALATAPARGADDKDMQVLLDKAIKAHGGAANLNKYLASTMKVKGKLSVRGQALDYTGDFSVQMPDRMREEITVEVMGKKYPVIQVLNKDKGWSNTDGKTTAMNKMMLKEAREEMHSGWVTQQLTPLKGKDYKLSPLGEIKVGGREAAGMRVSHKGYRDVSLYFDKKNYRLLKVEARAKDLMGGGDKEEKVETFYEDYKPVQGMPVPHRLVMKRDGKDFLTGEVIEVKLLEKLGDEVFAKP